MGQLLITLLSHGLKLALIATLSLSCTTINNTSLIIDQEPYHYIDSQFRPSLRMFEYEARSRGIVIDKSNLSITFGLIRSKGSKVVGTCSLDALGVMVIKIHDKSWKEMTPYEREELIFHELGHCLLGREHCTALDNGKPISIMFPSVLETNYYKNNREELIDELFDVDSRCNRDDAAADKSNSPVCTSAHPNKK